MTLNGSSPPLTATLDGVKLLSPIPIIIDSMSAKRWLSRLVEVDILCSRNIFEALSVSARLEAVLYGAGRTTAVGIDLET